MTLRDYQTDIAAKAVEILREHGIVYLAMQVRTGKTITALHTADLMSAQRVLFVTLKKPSAPSLPTPKPSVSNTSSRS